MQRAPYGSWKSPIGSDLVAKSSGVSFPKPSEDGVYWLETRTTEGRDVLVFRPWDAADSEDVVPPGFNVRNGVHEYGGGAYWLHGQTVFFTNFDDERLYRLDGRGSAPHPVTPEPPEPRSVRYADGVVTPDGATVVCVRERHEDGAVHNELVALPADGSEKPRIVASGHDFYAFPRLSPDGTKLAWISWDDPRMPFEGTELWVADVLSGIRVGEPRLVAGGPEEAIFQPHWSPDGVLHFVSDRTGWSNLYRETQGQIEPLTPIEAELGWMPWWFGQTSYDFLPDGRIACLVNRGKTQSLSILDDGELLDAGVPYDAVRSPFVRAHGTRVTWVAVSATEPSAVVVYDAEAGGFEVVRKATDEQIDPAYISSPEPIEFANDDGGTSFAFYYPPRNPEFEGPDGERPPLLVLVHGGPTSQSVGGLSAATQYLTSRGIAVVDVNYGGSTGYGRAYVERLKHRWGVVDTADSIAAARYLAERADVDGDRLAITGGSAGGYTTLCALAFADAFATGASFFGISDLLVFSDTTHKFEAKYDQWLLGPLPESEAVYRERSPITGIDNVDVPVLILQGLDDKVVPPSQAEIMVEGLRRNGTPFAYLAFEGEGHGFRKEANIRRSHEALTYFLSKVFGFELAEPVEPVEIEGL